MSGLAQTPGVLIAARVLQGMGAALAGPSVLALVMVMVRNAAEQARGMSLFIAVSSVGASAGLILGGVLTEYLSWRWALLINVPVGAIVLLTIGRLVAETHPKPARLDVAGAVSATLASVALVYGFISAADQGWRAAGTLLSFALVPPMLVLFLRVERRHREPLLDLHLLQDRSRVGALLVMALIVGMHFSLLFMLVQYLQRIMGYTPLLAGFAYLPLTATVFAISHLVPRLIARFGARTPLATGSVLVAASLAGFALLGSHASYFPIMHGVPDEHAGAVSGLLQMDQQIGGALGIAVIASIYSLNSVPGQYAAGLPAAFGVGAGIAMAAAVMAWVAVRAR